MMPDDRAQAVEGLLLLCLVAFAVGVLWAWTR